jgi:predicted ATPase
MVETIARGKAMPAELIRNVVAETDGVPLYVEEFMRNVLESDLLQEGNHEYTLGGSIPKLAIPSTLQDSLMARLDRLGSFKEVAQLASVLGREFSYELLAGISPLDAPLLDRGLAQLVGAELLYQRGVPPRAVYSFKHALIQETAYQSLLKSKRQGYHARVAQTLEDNFPERVSSHPEEVARHYKEAGFIEQAVAYYQRAGELASERSAHAEAIGHLTSGIKLISGLPESPGRNQQELLLQVTLGALLQLAQGYASPEAEQAYGRARALCQGIGEFPQLSRALWGLSAFYQARGELRTALELAEQLLELGGRPSLLVWAHVAMVVGPLYCSETG